MWLPRRNPPRLDFSPMSDRLDMRTAGPPADAMTWTAGEGLDVLVRIGASVASLPPSDARVANAILKDPKNIVYLSVIDVAELSETSTATVVRASQRLGFRGFQDLKLALAQSLSGASDATAVMSGLSDTAAPHEVLEHALQTGAQALRDAAATVDPASFAAAVDLLGEAGRVLIVAAGTSHPLAADVARALVSTGHPAEAPAEVMAQHLAARLLRPGELCIAISHTGTTIPTLQAGEFAREGGARVLAVTGFPRSGLAIVADRVLVVGSREYGFYLSGTARRLAILRVLQALCMAAAYHNPTRAAAGFEATKEVVAHHHH